MGNSHPRNVVTTGFGFCAPRAVASGSALKSTKSRREGRTGATASRTRAKARGRTGRQDKTHNIRRIHTCLPYTSLETTSYPDRQEPQHTGFHHQPQGQALPDFVKSLDGLSSTTAAALRNNLRLYPTRCRIFQLYPIPYRARAGHLRSTIGE